MSNTVITIGSVKVEIEKRENGDHAVYVGSPYSGLLETIIVPESELNVVGKIGFEDGMCGENCCHDGCDDENGCGGSDE